MKTCGAGPRRTGMRNRRRPRSFRLARNTDSIRPFLGTRSEAAVIEHSLAAIAATMRLVTIYSHLAPAGADATWLVVRISFSFVVCGLVRPMDWCSFGNFSRFGSHWLRKRPILIIIRRIIFIYRTSMDTFSLNRRHRYWVGIRWTKANRCYRLLKLQRKKKNPERGQT